MVAIDYHNIAQSLLFGNGTFDCYKHNVQYRKGKNSTDIDDAINKAAKNGFGKTECEISMLEIYLKGILKPQTS